MIVGIVVQVAQKEFTILPERVFQCSHHDPPLLIQIPFALAPCVININHFQFSVEIERGRALLAIADACAFDAAERNVCLAAGRRRVDVRHAGFNLIHKAENARGVVRKDRRRQAIFRVVGDLHRFVEILDADDAKHWPKDFLARDAHVGCDVIENGWAHEVAFVESVTGSTLATAHQRSAVFSPNVQITQDSLELILIDARPHFGLWIVAVTDSHRLRALRDPLDEFVGDLVYDDRAAGCRATLPRGSERALGRRFNRQIHIGILEDYDRVLATHFALTLGAAPRYLFIQTYADGVRSGERNSLDGQMIDDFVAGIRTRSENKIQNAGRHTGLFKDFNDAHGGGWRQRGGLEHNGVSGYQRRRNFPRRNRHRKIPRRYASNYAQRLLDRIDEVRWQLGKNRLAVHAPRLARAKLSNIDRALHLAARLAESFTLFARENLRQLIFRFFD